MKLVTFKNFSLSLSLLLLAACGSQSQNSSTNSAASSSSTSDVSGCSGNCENLPSAQQKRIEFSGINGPNYSTLINDNGGIPATPIYTSHTLRVKVEALPAPNMILTGFTNWNVSYGCMQITVNVNGATQATQILRVGSQQQSANSMCANAPTSQILDFSSTMTGYGPVTVTVNNFQYDNCRLQNTRLYGCSMSSMWQDHRGAANITIQNDGTYLE